MAGRGRVLLFFFLTFALHFTRLFSGDTLLQGSDFIFGEFLTSRNQVFNLNFFHFHYVVPPTIEDTQKLYLGITFNEQGRVWLANFNNPLYEISLPTLMIDDYGNMKIVCSKANDTIVIFSSGESKKINASATLQNNGNFLLREVNPDGSTKRILWQSFDYPTNFLLPGMKLGIDKRTGHSKWNLTSWVGPNSPVLGSFTLGMDPKNTSQLVMWWKGDVFWTSGALKEDGTFPNLKSNSSQQNHVFLYEDNENETYFSYIALTDDADAASIVLDGNGEVRGGVSVMCNGNDPEFVSGCVSLKAPACRSQEARVSMVDYRRGDMLSKGYYDTMMVSLYDCGVMCLNNCFCHAYSSVTQDNIWCRMWEKGAPFQEYDKGPKVYFIRDDHNDSASTGSHHRNTRNIWSIASVVAGAFVILSSY